MKNLLVIFYPVVVVIMFMAWCVAALCGTDLFEEFDNPHKR